MAAAGRNSPTVVVVGAGLAGLACAVSLAEAGIVPVVLERAHGPGGTSRLSSGQAWRYRRPADAAWGAPHADQVVLDVISRGLSQALSWLATRTQAVAGAGLARERTEGMRIDMPRAIDRLARALPPGALTCDREALGAERLADGRIRLVVGATPRRAGDPRVRVDEIEADAVVLCGGGSAGDPERVAREAGLDPDDGNAWVVRNAGLSDGTTIDLATALGAVRTPAGEGCFARLMADVPDIGPRDWVTLSQVYGAHATLVTRGDVVEHPANDWADSQLAWELALRGGYGVFYIPPEGLEAATPYGNVADAVALAAERGAEVHRGEPGTLNLSMSGTGRTMEPTPAALAAVARAVVSVRVRAGITHTLGGLRIDPHARVLGPAREPIPGLYAAGVDVGGLATGGYTSGLAQALVLGRVAAGTVAAQLGSGDG